jgi:release factor glutamine methyltransferase
VSESENPDGTVSWRQLRDEAERRLSRASGPDAAGVDPAVAALDARRIAERASGLEGADWVLGCDAPATRRGVAFFDTMLERRLAGEPLQYVVGSWGFRTLDLLVDRRVLIPRPETEVVVEHALAEVDRIRAATPDRTDAVVAVDLGTGSGAIGLSLAVERPGLAVWMTDASAEALAVAGANLAGLGRAGTGARLVEGSWFDALPAGLVGEIDVVVSNPPYVGTGDDLPEVVREWEPTRALLAGPDGLDDIRVLVDQAPRWLRPGGALVVELAPDQAAEVARLASGAGFVEVTVEPDLAGRPRCLVARRAGPGSLR